MSLETAKKAIDFLLEKSAGIKNLELDFFGGEPLLNFDVVKKLVAYGREKEKECKISKKRQSIAERRAEDAAGQQDLGRHER